MATLKKSLKVNKSCLPFNCWRTIDESFIYESVFQLRGSFVGVEKSLTYKRVKVSYFGENVICVFLCDSLGCIMELSLPLCLCLNYYSHSQRSISK